MDNELWVLMFQRLTNIAQYHHEDKWNWSCSTNSDDDIGPQVIYPDTQLEMGRKGWTDRDLEKVVIVMMVVMVMVRMILFFGPAPLNLPFRCWGRWPWWGGDDDDSEDKDHAISGDDEDWYKEAGVGYDGYGEINTEVLDTVILYPCNWINDDSEDEDHDIKMKTKMKTNTMTQVLDTVNLNHIVTREGGWDTAADWKVVIGEHHNDDDDDDDCDDCDDGGDLCSYWQEALVKAKT